MKQVKKTEEHISFTIEEGKYAKEYLTHRVIPEGEGTGAGEAKIVQEVLSDYNSLESLLCLNLDNTSSNTGKWSGLHAVLEQNLQRTLHLAGCQLHANELPLRHLIAELDGKTKDPKSYSGPLLKDAEKENNLKPPVDFEAIPSTIHEYQPNNPEDLSRDQSILLSYIQGIHAGQLEPSYMYLTVGGINHARWLTMAIRILVSYTRTPKHLVTDNQRIIVTYICQVYGPMWFAIKKSGKLSDSPKLTFLAIQLTKTQPENVQLICLKNIKHNAFSLLPENFLYAATQDTSCRKIRDKALNVILKTRNSPPKLPKTRIKKGVRVNEVPKATEINDNASQWWELIDWTKTIWFEPPATMKISENELQEALLSGELLKLPQFSNNSQSVERAVKLVSDASSKVYGQDARHQRILGILKSREDRKPFQNKAAYEHKNIDLA